MFTLTLFNAIFSKKILFLNKLSYIEFQKKIKEGTVKEPYFSTCKVFFLSLFNITQIGIRAYQALKNICGLYM